MTHTHQRFTATDQEREPFRADCPACNPATHTKGPWLISTFGTDVIKGGPIRIRSANGNGRHIADVVNHDDSYNLARANARLIAAAPELLTALKRALPLLDASYLDMVEKRGEHDISTLEVFDCKEQVDRAIAKAEGREL